MQKRIKDILNDKEYTIWLILALILLIVSQFLAKQPGTPALVMRWVLFAAAVIIYGVVLYLNDRNRRAKKKEEKK